MKPSILPVCLAALLCRAPAALAASIDVTPAALRLDRPPTQEYHASFLLRHSGQGTMNLLSVTATDPALQVAQREKIPGRVYVVTATIAPGYQTPPRQPVELIVMTDVKESSTLRIPISVHNRPVPDKEPWMAQARTPIASSGRSSPPAALSISP